MLGGDMLLDDYKFSVGNKRELFNIDPNPTTWTLAISTIFAMMSRCDSLQLDAHFYCCMLRSVIM
ncbi:hypothetical protein TVAG_384410 [Trichomonas vaginalis G3]|uniref:Uncharacterized protein n=1 Tax=Trichomonas vaginalis (strain ATCC PRA-98 / G3) TaxID=412133 RepID=A2FTP5_TRIV3|nr:hypothetical protein TVAGG3_0611650 [Trichomonas vaginalis G3]EAX91717.1 hypothetical protein TVAG_384410 [Trichomonas vaginalis G3]KAI5524619.1 hypothetical protein TVAGG3_0611650 [Trichomonas vaginalis G3]|eukprot:XP_001304647.1 hypothetical protein [Trichomonas vaginalis G3]